jgi:predicted transcriptional regulator
MELKLSPATEAYLLDRVRSGDYSTVGELVDAAIQQFRDEELQLSDEESRAIEEGEADFAAGRFMDFKTFAEEFRKQDAP